MFGVFISKPFKVLIKGPKNSETLLNFIQNVKVIPEQLIFVHNLKNAIKKCNQNILAFYLFFCITCACFKYANVFLKSLAGVGYIGDLWSL